MDGVYRLVRRIHQRWRANGSARHPALAPREFAELEARIKRLHAMGSCFTHVTLNDEVMQVCMTGARSADQGAFVCKDV